MALWRQPYGWCGPLRQWVGHPCEGDTTSPALHGSHVPPGQTHSCPHQHLSLLLEITGYGENKLILEKGKDHSAVCKPDYKQGSAPETGMTVRSFAEGIPELSQPYEPSCPCPSPAKSLRTQPFDDKPSTTPADAAVTRERTLVAQLLPWLMGISPFHLISELPIQISASRSVKDTMSGQRYFLSDCLLWGT